MIEAHIASGAGVTVAAIRQPIALANQFGVIEVDADDPTQIRAFLEKPENPIGLADSPDEVLASMGNYIFDADALIEAVHARRRTRRLEPRHGRRHRPRLRRARRRGRLRPQPQRRARVDRSRPLLLARRGNDRLVLRRAPGPDLGAADLQPVQPRVADLQPAAQLAAGEVRARRARLPRHDDRLDRLARFAARREPTSSAACSGPWTTVESGAMVVDSVVFERVRIEPNAVVRRAILDKNVVVEAGATVGVDRDADRARGFTVTDIGNHRRRQGRASSR